MWKKCIAALCAVTFFVSTPGSARCVAAGSAADASNAKGAALIDLDSGRLLFGKDADKRLPMASTTKIMSALLTLEQTQLDAPFVVDETAIRVEGSSMGLRKGDTVTLRALVYGMLLPSGNDAANAAAVRIAGSQAAFVQRMNDRAEELGLENTHFVTPSGLDDEAHYSTARDMALLAREALSNPDFADICSQSTAKVRFGAPPYDRWLKNHNKLLTYRDDVFGVKTGFTKTAGRCLVSAARQGEVGLVAVTLGCGDDWGVHSTLYDTYFAKAERKTLDLPQLTIPVAGAAPLETEWAQKELTLLRDETPDIRITMTPMLFAPVQKGRVVGMAQVVSQGEVIAQIPLTAKEAITVPREKPKGWRGWFWK